MEKFGFNSKPPIDLPEDEVLASGVYDLEHDRLLTRNDPVDLARVAIGQERLLATPLQMAMVAAAIANEGKLMKPQLWSRVIDPDGRVVKKLDPSQYSEPVSSEDRGRADHGDGRRGQRRHRHQRGDSGVPVAGKTGTAETPGNKSCGGGNDENQAWFIGFAPANDPKIAIAASVECTTQFGNDVAAPIFRDVAEAILNGE